MPFVLSSSLLCLPLLRFRRALARILDVLCGGSGASLLSRASAAMRLLVLNTDAGIVALPLLPLTNGLLDGDELVMLDLGLEPEVVVVGDGRILVLVDDLTEMVPGVLASLATLLLDGWQVSVDDDDGFLGLDNLSVTAAAVALTLDLTVEDMVGLVGRLVVDGVCGEGSTEFLDVLPVDLRGEDVVL